MIIGNPNTNNKNIIHKIPFTPRQGIGSSSGRLSPLLQFFPKKTFSPDRSTPVSRKYSRESGFGTPRSILKER